MTIEEAQREMRMVFLGGSVGQAVSGAIWLVSAALAEVLIGGGVAFAILLPQRFAPAGWFTGAVMVLFALWVGFTSRR